MSNRHNKDKRHTLQLMAKELESDELWEIIEPLLPSEPPKPNSGRRRIDDRAAVTGTSQFIERRRAEEEPRESEERFRLLIDGVQDCAIFMLDPEGRVANWNLGAKRIKGYSAEEIVGQHFSRFYTEEDIERGCLEEALRIAARDGRFAEVSRRVRRDGSHFWASVAITALRDELGDLRGFSNVTRDVTERKKADEGLRRSLDILLALREAGQILGSTLESEEVVSRLLEIMRRVSNLTTAVISVRDEDGRVRIWRSTGLERLWPRARFAPEAEAARQAVLDTERRQLFRLRRPDSQGEDLTGLLLPLRVRDRLLVVLEAYGAEDLADEEMIEIIGSLTSQAATALENALLYQDVAEREQRLQELVSQLLKTQEEERRRVAYEVHDGLAQVATAAHQRLQAYARRHLPGSQRGEEDLGRIVRLVHQTVGEARRIIGNLRPTALDDFGLAAAVDQELDHLRGEGWSVHYEQKLGNSRLPAAIETALFRVAQEALTNVRKHAKSGEVCVELSRDNGGVRLRVRDRGEGFDPGRLNTTGPGERVGLAGMRERIALLGGKFELWSRPGEGTAVTVDVPLRATEEDGRGGG